MRFTEVANAWDTAVRTTAAATSAPTSAAARTVAPAIAAAPAVATTETANTTTKRASTIVSISVLCPLGSSFMIGLLSKATYRLCRLALSRLVKRPWVGS